MTIWLHTRDPADLEGLRAHLAGAGVKVEWEGDAARFRERLQRETPAVAVFDTACEEHAELALELKSGAPWARVLLLGAASAEIEVESSALPAPCAPAELAPRLVREAELAEIEKSRHEIEIERRRLERGLENAERLATIGRVAIGMAHEINNPLAVIRASAAYVAEIAARLDDSELGLCASDIEAAVERVGIFVQQVTSFARSERPQVVNTSLGTAIDIALRMVKPQAKELNVQIAVAPCPRAPVPHDPPRLAQAVLNLLANAVEAAQARGSHVSVRVGVDETDAWIEIEDDGPGVLDLEAREPPRTARPRAEPEGLGLGITRQIAADHGGRVEIERAGRGGVRARIALPRFSAAVYRLLVIHDDASARRGLATDLRREGFDVVTASSFSAARECLRERRVHLVIADSGLSELGDTLLSRALARASASSRVIALCPGADLSRGAGADHALATPCERGELLRVARALCLKGERRPSGEPPAGP